jgi:hypothetical protein
VRRLARLLLLATAGAACNVFAPQTEILDGWSIGEPVTDCRSERPPLASCEDLVGLARESVGADPSTPGLVFLEGIYVTPDGREVRATAGGGRQLVVVLEHADGVRQAIGVFCGLTDCLARGEPAYRP